MNFIFKNQFKTLFRYLVLSVLFILSFTAIAESNTELIKLEHKPQAPMFNLPDRQDTWRKLTDYLGKPVIVSFWATWCQPCREEIPYFNRAWEKVKDDGIEILFVNINEAKETIEAYEKKVPIKATILRDEAALQLYNWNMVGLPTTFIIDPKGRVVYQAIGMRAWDSDEILDKVRALKTKPSADKTSKAEVIEKEKQG